MNARKNKSEIFQNIFYIFVYVFIILVAIYIVNEIIKNNNLSVNKYIKLIGVSGYELDKDFSENEYYYTVMVDEDELEIVCETDYDAKGCWEKINLNGQNSYHHEIVLMAENKETKYILNIQKNEQIADSSQSTNNKEPQVQEPSKQEPQTQKPQVQETPKQEDSDNKNRKLKILSIEGNPRDWTNRNVRIKVNAESSEGIDSYSFDGGLTWQKESSKTISSNTTLKVMVKDKTGMTTSSREVKVSKIDKVKPTVSLIKSSATNREVTLKATSSDDLSGIEGISFNNNSYSNRDTLKIRSTGTYSVKVKDRAGNVSEVSSISVQKTDFAENRGETKKTYTLTLDANGATISQNSVSCTTTGESCQVTLPTISKNGYNILGWGTSSTSKTAQYKSGEKVTISKNQILYAITYKTLTATFNKNGATSVGSNSLSCTLYNKNTNCTVKMPSITRSGGSVIGWNRAASSDRPTMKVGETLTLNSNVTYYAITYKVIKATYTRDTKETDKVVTLSKSSDNCNLYNTQTACNVTLPSITARGKTIMGIYKSGQSRDNPPYKPTQTVSISSNTTFYARTGTVRGYGIVRNPYGVDEITGIKNAPNQKIIIEYDKECSSTLGSYKTALKNIYNKAPYLFRVNKIFLLNNTNYAKTNSDNPNSVGMQHGIPQGQAIDIKCQYFKDYVSRESTLVHELAHSMDGYYVLQKNTLMNPKFSDLYTKYKSKSTFSSYSKTNTLEFFAEIYRHYYYTYLSSNNSGYKIVYPNDVKARLESYINSAKSQW